MLSLTNLVLRELWLSPSSHYGNVIGSSKHLRHTYTRIEICKVMSTMIV